VKGLSRKHNRGRKWEAIPPCVLRWGQRTKDELPEGGRPNMSKKIQGTDAPPTLTNGLKWPKLWKGCT